MNNYLVNTTSVQLIIALDLNSNTNPIIYTTLLYIAPSQALTLTLLETTNITFNSIHFITTLSNGCRAGLLFDRVTGYREMKKNDGDNIEQMYKTE